MSDISSSLRKFGIQVQLDFTRSWRAKSDVFHCSYKKQPCLLKVIDLNSDQGELESVLYDLKEEVKDELLLKVVKSFEIDGFKYIIFATKGECTFYKWKNKKQNKIISAIKMILSILQSMETINHLQWKISDQIISNIALGDKSIKFICPVIISNQSFYSHVFSQYLLAKTHGNRNVFAYSPETLAKSLEYQINKDLPLQIFRDDESETLWSVCVLLFLMLGCESQIILNLASSNSQAESQQCLESFKHFDLIEIFKKAFSFEKSQRYTKEELIKELTIILNSLRNGNQVYKLQQSKLSDSDDSSINLFRKGKQFYKSKKYEQSITFFISCQLKLESEGDEPTVSKYELTNYLLKVTKKQEDSFKKELKVQQTMSQQEREEEEVEEDNRDTTESKFQTELSEGSIYKWDKNIWKSIVLRYLGKKLKRNELKQLLIQIQACLSSIFLLVNSNELFISIYQQAIKNPMSLAIQQFFWQASLLAKEEKIKTELQQQMIELARIYFDLRLLDVCQQHVKQIIELDKNNVEAYLLLCQIQLKLSKNEEALKISDKGINLHPFSPAMYLIKQKCLRKIKNQFIKKINRVVEEKNVVNDKDEQKELLREIKSMKKEMRSESDEDHYALAKLYLKLHNTPLAISHLESCVKINPLHSKAIKNLAQIFKKLGNFKQAEQSYKRLVEINSNQLSSYYQLFDFLRSVDSDENNSHHIEELIKIGFKCIEIDDQIECSYLMLIDLLEKQQIKGQESYSQQLRRVYEMYSQNIKLLPNETKMIKLIEEQLKKPNVQQATIIINETNQLYPKCARLKYKLACILSDNNFGYIIATELLIHSIKMIPDNYHYKFRLAQIYLKLSLSQEAITYLLEVISQCAYHSISLAELGKLSLYESKDPLKAKQYLKRSIKISVSPGVYGALGVAYYKLGKIQKAISCLEASRQVKELGKEFVVDHAYGKCLLLHKKYDESYKIFHDLSGRYSVNKIKMLYYMNVCLKNNNKKINYEEIHGSKVCKIKEKVFLQRQNLASLILEEDDKVLILMKQKIDETLITSKDPDLCAYYSEIHLNLGNHPYLAMHFIEMAFGHIRFNEKEDVDDDLPLGEGSKIYFGCLVQEAKIWFLLENYERSLKKIMKYRKIMHEKQNELISRPNNLSNSIEEKKRVKESWSSVNWYFCSEFVLAQVYLKLKKFEEAEQVINELLNCKMDTRQKKEYKYLRAFSLVCQNKGQEAISTIKKNPSFTPSILLMGVQLFKQKKYAEGRQQFSAVNRFCQQNLQHLINMGDLEFSIMNYSVAYPFYKLYQIEVEKENAILSKNESVTKRQILHNYQTMTQYGKCLVLDKQKKLAIEVLEISISINPNQPEALLLYGRACYDSNEYKMALEKLKKSSKLKESAEIYYYIGMCHKQMNNIEEALKFLILAEQLNDKYIEALREIGEILIEQKEYQNAMNYFKKIIALDANDEAALLGMANCYWLGDHNIPSAEICFKKCVDQYKKSPKSFHQYIKFFQETNRLPSADYILSFKNIYEKNVEVLLYLGTVFFESASQNYLNYQYAHQLLTILVSLPELKKRPHQFNLVHLRLAQIAYLSKEMKNSLKFLQVYKIEKLRKKQPSEKLEKEKQEKFEYYLLKSRLDIYFNKPQIQKSLLKCMELQPNNQLPFFIFALQLIQKNSKSAWTYLEKGVKLEVNNENKEQVVLMKALKEVQNQDINEGISILSTYLKKNESQICLFNLGHLQLLSLQYEKSAFSYEKCIQDQSSLMNYKSFYKEILSEENLLTCYLNLGKAYFALKKKDEALKFVYDILKINSHHSQALKLRSQIYLETGNHYNAIESAQSSLKGDSTDSQTFYILAQANLQSGNTISAIRSLEKCLEIDQHFPFGYLKLAEIQYQLQKPQNSLNSTLMHLSLNPTSCLGLAKSSRLLIYIGKYVSAQSHIDRLFEELARRDQANMKNLKKKEVTLSHILDDNLDCFNEESITLAHAHIVQGYFHKAMNDLPSAIQEYNKALTYDSSNEDALFSLAVIYQDLGNIQEEMLIYQQLIEMKDTKNTGKYFVNLGNVYQKQSLFFKAIQSYKKAIKILDDECPLSIYSNEVYCHIKSGEYENARRRNSEILSQDRNNTLSLYLEGIYFEHFKDMTNATKYYERSISSNLSYFPAYQQLIQLKQLQNKLSDAIKVCQYYFQNNLNNNSIQYYQIQLLYGSLQLKQRDYLSALSTFDSILKKIPNQQFSDEFKPILVASNIQKARVFMFLHEKENAISHLHTCLNLSPDNPEYLHELGTLLSQNHHNLPFSLSLLKKALNASPYNPTYAFSIANVLHDMKETDLEIQALNNCLEMNPKFADEVLNSLGLAYSSQGKLETAIQKFNEGLKINPNSSVLHYNLGNVLQQQNSFKESIDSYENSIKLDSKNVKAYHNLALVSFKSRNYQKAADCLQQCLLLQPQSRHLYSSRLNFMMKRGYIPKYA